MKVKDFVKLLQQENQELEIVFWNELMDDNHWGCILSTDDVNNREEQVVNLLTKKKHFRKINCTRVLSSKQ